LAHSWVVLLTIQLSKTRGEGVEDSGLFSLYLRKKINPNLDGSTDLFLDIKRDISCQYEKRFCENYSFDNTLKSHM
jgi:hypothetical protein